MALATSWRQTISWWLLIIFSVSTIYASITGSPTIIFFYDRLLVLAGSRGCSLSLNPTKVRRDDDTENEGEIAYHETSLEYRWELDEEVTMKLRENENSAALDRLKYVTTSSSALSVAGAGGTNVAGESSSLLIRTSSSSCNDDRNSHNGMLPVPAAGRCDSRAADSRYNSTVLSDPYKVLLSILLSSGSAYFVVLTTDWTGKTSPNSWSSNDATPETVVVKLLGGCAAVWVVYIGSLLSSYTLYVENKKLLLQIFHV
jgi:hypothetical protein